MTDPTAGPAQVPDPRPRPQYGEYATAEEQRARIQQPDATEALVAGQALDEPAVAVKPSRTATVDRPRPAAPDRTARPAALTGWRLADRVATIGMLIYGLLNVVVTAVQLFDFDQYADSMYDVLGVDETFSNIAQGRLWGAIAGIVLIAGWILTAFLSWRSLRRGRVTFWIPLVGAVLFGTVVAVLICIPIFNDPAFGELIDRFSPAGS